MASKSEFTFGSRLQNARDLKDIVSAIIGFNPPRPQESPASYGQVIDDTSSSVEIETDSDNNYSKAVKDREAGYKKGPDSLNPHLVGLRGHVESLYGRKSKEAKIVANKITKFRSQKTTKAPVDPSKPDALKIFSKSQLSHGSLAAAYKDLVATVTSFTNYSSTNPLYTPLALSNRQLNLVSLNSGVASTFTLLKNSRKNRNDLYAELSDRSDRIKSHLKSIPAYEVEFKLAAKLKI